jgi:hypothetical protein
MSSKEAIRVLMMMGERDSRRREWKGLIARVSTPFRVEAAV